MYCDQCGEQVDINASFCSGCGTSLNGGDGSQITSRAKELPNPPPEPQVTTPSPRPVSRVPSLSPPLSPRQVGRRRGGRASPTEVISNWSTLIEGLQASSLGFYASLEAALDRRRIPDISLWRVDWSEGGIFSAKREYLRVRRKDYLFDVCAAPFGSGFFVSWWLTGAQPSLAGVAALLALICVAVPTPLAALLIISERLLGASALVLLLIMIFPPLWLLFYVLLTLIRRYASSLVEIPVIGLLFELIFKPVTYYKLDTAAMFRIAVHGAVQDCIDELTSKQGLRTLSEFERRPIMRNF